MLEEIRKLSSWMLSEDRGCSALQHKNSLQVFSTGVMERWLWSFVRGEEKSRELWQRSLCCSWEGEKIAQRTTCAECVEPEGSGNCWLCLLSFCLFLRHLRDVFGRRAESHNKQRWKVVLWQMGFVQGSWYRRDAVWDAWCGHRRGKRSADICFPGHPGVSAFFCSS